LVFGFAGVSSKPRPLGPSKLRVKEGGYRVASGKVEAHTTAGPGKPHPYCLEVIAEEE
jgi:hypothetical protein